MSMVLTRSPLEAIGMNGAGLPKRRSARLSGESVEENEPPAKKNKVDGAQTSTVGTKEADGDSAAVSRKKRKGKTPATRGERWFTFAILNVQHTLLICWTAC